MQTLMTIIFCANLGYIDVSLLLVDDSLRTLWRDIFETLMFSMETFLIFLVFVVLTFQLLMFHCYFIDDSLTYLWRTVEVTAKLSMQTIMIMKVFIDLMSETLMFHCFFIYDSLMTLRRTIADTTNIWTQKFLINRAFNVHYFKFWCFLAAWLVNGCWWHFQETLMGPWGFRCKQYW